MPLDYDVNNIIYLVPKKLRGTKIEELGITIPKDSFYLYTNKIPRDNKTRLNFLKENRKYCKFNIQIYNNPPEEFYKVATKYFLDSRHFNKELVLNEK